MAKSSVKQSPKVKLAQKVVTRATELTKKELKSKEIKKTVVSYPKGLYASTLKKNYTKARRELALPIAKKATKKKTTSKSSSSKKSGSKKKK